MSEVTITPGELVRGALLLVGAVDREKALSGTELVDGMNSLNHMVAGWSANKLVIPVVTKESFTLTVGKGSYTFGDSGADFTTERPIEVLGAYIRSSNGIDYDLERLSRSRWNEVIEKGTNARPHQFYYHPSSPLGTLYFNSEPTAAETLYMDSQKVMGNFTDSETAITLPAHYINLIKYQLAVYLAPEYGMEPSTEVYNVATSLMSDVKALNSESFDIDLDPSLVFVGRNAAGYW